MAKKKVELDGLDFGGELPDVPQEEQKPFIINKPQSKTKTQGVRRISATLKTADAIRFKRAAEDNGYKLHDAIITGINRLMAEWQEPAVSNVGSTYKK